MHNCKKQLGKNYSLKKYKQPIVEAIKRREPQKFIHILWRPILQYYASTPTKIFICIRTFKFLNTIKHTTLFLQLLFQK